MSEATSSEAGQSSKPFLHAITDTARQALRTVARHSPAVKRALQQTSNGIGLAQHTVAAFAPCVIRARPRRITIAVTSYCNFRCKGCLYGRGFMDGHQLSLGEVRGLLDDAKAAGVEMVRLYGGEPLLHRDLPAMVRHAVELGLSTYITTNGALLRQKIDALHDAGLRNITLGFYGTGAEYDSYVQRQSRFAKLEEGLEYARSRYGDAISLQLNYLIMRPSLSVTALTAAWEFAQRYDMSFHTDLIHYSLPYFTDGGNDELHFKPEDEADIHTFVAALARLKKDHPARLRDSIQSIHSIPHWLQKGPAMRVPCDAGNLLWVGANGAVQLCYVTFPLGNIRERPLREMLFTPEHHAAARDAFVLACPNCHCERNSRIAKHAPSRWRYNELPAPAAP